MATPDVGRSRLMLLYTTTGYEAREFIRTAQQLGVETVLGSDRCDVLDDPWEDDAVPLRFECPQEAARRIVDVAGQQPVAAILPVGDTPLLSAAKASRELGLLHNPPDAVLSSHNKYLMRQRLQADFCASAGFYVFPDANRPPPRATRGSVPMCR